MSAQIKEQSQMGELITLHNGFRTQTPALAPGASENADLRREICVVRVNQRPDFESVR
jgi:hypothetical protein